MGLVGKMSNLNCTAENLDGVGAVDDGRGGAGGDCLPKLKAAFEDDGNLKLK